ncbi:hypothetical protein SBDP1_1690002 [Syntrophobacter sp. SbD1]|nr:hypothetical protein SBDP1_1690002 [Syntrophobacter sp. SbD1]
MFFALPLRDRQEDGLEAYIGAEMKAEMLHSEINGGRKKALLFLSFFYR